VLFYGVRGGLTSRAITPDAVQAVDPSSNPIDGTIASLTVSRDGGTNTVTVTPGTLETDTSKNGNWLCIMRNEHVLPPFYIQSDTTPVVFEDSGLDPTFAEKAVYTAFIWNSGKSGPLFGDTSTPTPPPTPPQFANGTPIAAIVGNVQKVQIDWTADTAGAGGVRVEASIDGTTVRVVGTGDLESGTVYDPQTGPKLYRLVAYSLIPSVDVVTGPWTWYTGGVPPLSNPSALPTFVNGTPKVVFADAFPSMAMTLGIEWKCATPGAAIVVIRRSTTGSGGTYSTVPGGSSAAVANGAWKAPVESGNVSTYVSTEAWYKLEARASDLTTVLASSGVVHWVPPV
jgi:hypothetical protein